MKSQKPRPYYVGVDLGGTKILAAVFDRRNRLLSREKMDTKPERGPSVVIQRVTACVNAALAAAGVRHAAVAAGGVGVPGAIRTGTGLVLVAPNLHWTNVPFGRLLERRLGFPIRVVNDVQAGTLAVQQVGAGRRLRDFVCMFIGTGIGGGLVLGGTPYRGSTGMGGELGHMVVVQEGALRCGCGNRGCLETVASRSAIVRRIVNAIEKGRKTSLRDFYDGDVRTLRSRVIAEAYQRGDKLVRKVINEACGHLGVAAANLINLLDPQAVIFGGGLIEALGDRMLPLIRRTAEKHVMCLGRKRVRVCDSGLGDDAGIIGGLLVARTPLEGDARS